jgi:hypothetical protein|tara:strand:- start:212 stop:439 length:228 start_codon:yes stop_codon:yes gene_type:complete
MTASNLKIRWLKRNLKKIKDDLWIDHSFEQWREIMCGCYENQTDEQIEQDLNRRIEADSTYQEAERKYEEALNEL